VIYSIVGGIEVIFKIVFVVLVFNKKRSAANECTAHSIAPPSCIGWRLDDLDLTNSVVFHTISSITQVILIIYSIQLTIFAFDRQKKLHALENMRKANEKCGRIGPYNPSRSEMTDLSAIQDSQTNKFVRSEPDRGTYGTFRVFGFLDRFKKNHYLTTTM
jgi:hypothetical protein